MQKSNPLNSNIKNDSVNNIQIERYLKSHLKRYIVFSLEQGYEINVIKSSLIRQGYKRHMLNEIIEELPHTNHTIKTPEYNPRELDKETRYYLEGVLTDYVEKMLKHGYEKNEIKKALINYGHHPSLVNNVFNKFKSIKTPNISFESLSYISLFIYGIFTLLLVMQLNAPTIGLVLFLPGILSLIISITLINKINKKGLVPLIDFLMVILISIGTIMLLVQSRISLENFDIEIIIGINIILSLIFSSALTVSYGHTSNNPKN